MIRLMGPGEKVANSVYFCVFKVGQANDDEPSRPAITEKIVIVK
jgi:hypothetical protein